MATLSLTRWAPPLATLVLWALAGASAVYWGLRLSEPAAGPAPVAAAPEPILPDAQALARLLGAHAQAAAATPAAASRFTLLGVLAGTQSGDGAALIAVDGKPPRHYRVGAAIEPGLVLQSLGRREARLGASVDGATTLALELPRQLGLQGQGAPATQPMRQRRRGCSRRQRPSRPSNTNSPPAVRLSTSQAQPWVGRATLTQAPKSGACSGHSCACGARPGPCCCSHCTQRATPAWLIQTAGVGVAASACCTRTSMAARASPPPGR